MISWKVILITPLLIWTDLADAREWTVDLEHSRLGFTASWEGMQFRGVFRRFEADMIFEPDTPGTGRFVVRVDVTSIDTDSHDRDQVIGDPEWFFFRRYPEATFVTTGIRHVDDDRYLSDALLTLKGTTRPVQLEFRWMETGTGARLVGQATLQRDDFRIGEGEWATGEVIGLEVRVDAAIALVSSPN